MNAGAQVVARNPQTVSRVLGRAGFLTGVRYSAFGYTDRRTGARITGPAVIVTRQREGRYGGREDLGEIRVYCIDVNGHDPGDEYVEAVLAALVAAGLPATRRTSTVVVEDS